MGVRDLLKKYENSGSNVGWFKLANDGDSTLVRFLNTNVDDLEVFEVHKVEVDGFFRAILCKGDNCTMCRGGNRSQLRMWLPMQNMDKTGNPVEIWERGKNDIQSIIGLIDENGNLNERDYKIKRVGKAGDKKTTYQYFYKDKSVRTDLPEKPKILGRYVLELSEQDMQRALDGTLTLKKDDSQKSNGTANNAVSDGTDVF